jgi:hypothetical protein
MGEGRGASCNGCAGPEGRQMNDRLLVRLLAVASATVLASIALIVFVITFVGPRSRGPGPIDVWLVQAGEFLTANRPLLMLIGVGLLALVGAVGLGLAVSGMIRSCPACKKWWAKVETGIKVLKRKECYGLVKRYSRTSTYGHYSGSAGPPGNIHHHNHGGTYSTSSGTVWQERVPVIRTTYARLYRCKKCGWRWSHKFTEEVEDFDRS